TQRALRTIALRALSAAEEAVKEIIKRSLIFVGILIGIAAPSRVLLLLLLLGNALGINVDHRRFKLFGDLHELRRRHLHGRSRRQLRAIVAAARSSSHHTL